MVQRARIVLMTADGVVRARFLISRQTVIDLRARYEQFEIDGFFDQERSDRPRTLDRQNSISVTLTPPPAKYVVTHEPPQNAIVLCVDWALSRLRR